MFNNIKNEYLSLGCVFILSLLVRLLSWIGLDSFTLTIECFKIEFIIFFYLFWILLDT